MDLFELFAAAFKPIENQKSLASCVLLSVSDIGQQIVEDVEEQFDYGKFETENVLEFPNEYPFTLYCDWKACYEYEIDEIGARLINFEFQLVGEIDGESVDLNIDLEALSNFVLYELTKN